MNLFVLVKMVPDTVEELSVANDGKSLDSDSLRFRLSDSDEHALEQALLLKEKGSGTVTVVALDSPEVDDVLYTALAKGADRTVKLIHTPADTGSLAAARLFASWLKREDQPLPADALILLRSQSIDDLEGEIGPVLAVLLGLPYVCVVTSVRPSDDGLSVTKEFAGGLRGEFSLPLPAVLGIQSAEKPPRYVPIAKVRAVMKSAKIETVEVPLPESLTPYPVERMYKPEVAARTHLLEGTPDEVTEEILEVLVKSSVI